jgi:hypothetical protein
MQGRLIVSRRAPKSASGVPERCYVRRDVARQISKRRQQRGYRLSLEGRALTSVNSARTASSLGAACLSAIRLETGSCRAIDRRW